MKYIAIILVLFLIGCAQPPQDVSKAQVVESTPQATGESLEGLVAIDTAQSSFEFEGFGPGKSHVGTFNNYEGFLQIEDDQVIGAQGTIYVNSAKTDSGGLDGHLQTDDFFDPQNFPIITFSSANIADGTMVGDLTFLGITQTISFPVTTSQNSLSADFLLDITPYGIKYFGISDEVRITFEMIAQ